MSQNRIFSEVKVVELASVLAGPSVGTFFAELGAEVIKVENPKTGGDTTRQWKTTNEDEESPVSAYYASANWGKQSIELDLGKSSDFEKLESLLETADILLTNFKDGDAARFGLNFDLLHKKYPRLIVGQIVGFPQDDRPAFDIVLQAESGFMSLNGFDHNKVMKWPLPIVDILAAHQLKEGLLAALYDREKSGKGAFIQVSLFDAAIASLFNIGTNVLMTNADPMALGPLHPNIAPYGETITTADHITLVLAIGTDLQFASLCEILDTDQNLRKNFSTNRERVIGRIQLVSDLKRLALKFQSDVFIAALNEKKVPFGRVKSVKSVLSELPESYFLEQEIDHVNTIRLKTIAFTFTR